MTFATSAPAQSPFRMGDVLQATFDAAFVNFGVFVLLAMVLYSVPVLLVKFAFPAATALTGQPGLVVASVVVSAIVSMACSALLQGALMRGVISHLNGVKPRFGECLRAGLSAGAPLVAIGLIAGLGVGLGFLFLVVPGVFLLVLWSVAAPAQVVERAGVFRALGRSAELTEGHRWSVLGVLFVIGILLLVIVTVGSAVAGLVLGTVGIATGGLPATGANWGSAMLMQSAIGVVAGGVAAVFSSAAPAAIYYGLRRAKEGSAPASLAAVFD